MKNRNIDIYLRTAFRELEAFSIPDVGTFRKIYRSAAVSEDREQVRPPVIEIEFEEVVRDSVPLAGYLQNIIQLPAGESAQIVGTIRQSILASLREQQRFEINDIGTLKQLDDGHLVFIPADKATSLFATDFFGLKPVQLAGASATVLDAEASDKTVPMMNTKRSKKKNLAGSIGWKPVLVVALFIALGFILIQNGPFISSKSELSDSHTIPRNNADQALSSEPETAPEAMNADSNQLASGMEIPDSTVPGTVRQEAVGNTPAVSEASNDPATENPEEIKDGVPEAESPELLAEGNTTSGIETEAEAGTRSLTPATDVRSTRSAGVARGDAGTSDPIDISVLDTTNQSTLNALQGTSASAASNARNARKRTDAQRQSDVNQSSEQKIERYYLIVGSFSSSRSAATFVQELEAKEGAKAQILFPPAGSSQSYRVSVFNSKDRKQVLNYSNMLESLGKKSGWIYAKPAK